MYSSSSRCVFSRDASKTLLRRIVSGVGFLGAGTIIKSADGGLTGLTTATTIWTAAALGLCSGSASLDYRLCLIAVALVVACLQLVILFVSRIAVIWVACFSRSQRRRCWQEDWAHARIAATAMSATRASCSFVVEPAQVAGRIRAVLERTARQVGAVRGASACRLPSAHQRRSDLILNMKGVCLQTARSR